VTFHVNYPDPTNHSWIVDFQGNEASGVVRLQFQRALGGNVTARVCCLVDESNLTSIQTVFFDLWRELYLYRRPGYYTSATGLLGALQLVL